ncbi:MAG: hypothetical protein JNM48_11645, partial [Rhodospirillales bacterium]|nr:hypothetical protein [Rhodospirillales bacterium]
QGVREPAAPAVAPAAVGGTRGEAGTVTYAASETTVLFEGAAALDGAPTHAHDHAQAARLKGYEGDSCDDCGNFTLVRNGTCLKCVTCGSTTGCS